MISAGRPGRIRAPLGLSGLHSPCDHEVSRHSFETVGDESELAMPRQADRWMATGSRQQARSAIAHSPHLLDTEGRGMGIAEKTRAGLLGGRGTDLDEALASDSSRQ